LKSKRTNSPLTLHQESKTVTQIANENFQAYCDFNIRLDMGRYDYVPGINSPYNAGIHKLIPAILDTGANFTYVNDRRLINNIKPHSALVEVADGFVATGTLV